MAGIFRKLNWLSYYKTFVYKVAVGELRLSAVCGCGCLCGFPVSIANSDVQICLNDLIFGNLSYLFVFKEIPSNQESL